MGKVAFIVVLCLAFLPAGCHRKKKAPVAEKAPQSQSAAVAVTDDNAPVVFTGIEIGDRISEQRLLRGFYEANGPWRWTARTFAVSLDVPQPLGPTLLEVDLHIPEESVQALPNVTLTARVNHQDVFKRKFTGQGSRTISVPVPAPLLQKSPVEIDFELDGSFRDKETGREMGIILLGVRLKHPDGTVESRDTD